MLRESPLSWGEHLQIVMVDFKALHFIPVVVLKSASTVGKESMSPIEPLSRMRTSSTKSR